MSEIKIKFKLGDFYKAIKGFLHSSKNDSREAEKIRSEKEVLKKYDDALKTEQNTKNFQRVGYERKSGGVAADAILMKNSKVPKNSKTLKQSIKNGQEKFMQSWDAPQILKTNLAKGEETLYIDWEANIRKLVFLCFVSVFFVTIVFIALIVWGINTKNEAVILDNEINFLKSKVASSLDSIDMIDDFYRKLSSAEQLLGKHVYWSNVFEFFEDNTLKNVQIVDGLRGKPQGEYTFSIIADDFTVLNQQVEYWRSLDQVVDVQFGGGTFVASDKGGGIPELKLGSSVVVKLKPEIFYHQ